jgi:hypothetical protein
MDQDVYTAHRVKAWMADNQVPLMDWPSPDLNPIENLWSILDQKCCHRRVNSKEQLFEVLHDTWNSISVETLERLVDSMPDRCRAVIKAKRFLTKYLNMVV